MLPRLGTGSKSSRTAILEFYFFGEFLITILIRLTLAPGSSLCAIDPSVGISSPETMFCGEELTLIAAWIVGSLPSIVFLILCLLREKKRCKTGLV